MWIFTQDGMYSVVAYDPDRDRHMNDTTRELLRAYEPEDLVLVRGRVEDDMRRLGFPYEKSPEGDYAFRVVMSKDDWSHYLDESVRDIDYDNFKNRVSQVWTPRRDKMMHRIWAAMAAAQKKPPWSEWHPSYAGWDADSTS